MEKSDGLKESGFIRLMILAYTTAVVCVALVVAVAQSNVCTAAAPFGYQARNVLEMMAELNLLLLFLGAFADASSATCRRSVFFRLCAVSTLIVMYWAVLASRQNC